MSFDTIIRGARVVTPAGVSHCDIGITDGRITALGLALDGAGEVIDASGLIAMPGGIDSHVHIAQPSGPGIEMADDFHSATRSAAAGGNTTVMPFCLPEEGRTLREAVAAYHAKAEGRCHCDVSFHLIIKQTDPVTLGQDLPALIAAGHTSFKVFMTYKGLALSDRQILDVMAVAREQDRQGRTRRAQDLPQHPQRHTRRRNPSADLLSEGVVKGRISLERFAAITATNHARLYGLKTKGAIMVGMDADIVLWDPALTRPIRQQDLSHGADYTPGEGFQVTGWPVRTILRGATVMQDGVLSGAPTGGHIARSAPDILL